tara:strand:- start:3061 stop:3651 length:591 start_codon:yes stop_codon:yes gene_type:complete
MGVRGRNFDSDYYWENRYQEGGDSGAGSYGDLCEYKAKQINTFIRDKNIHSVIDFGCGDGNQLLYLECKEYLGLDVSLTVLAQVRDKFNNEESKRFELYYNNTETAELGLSCEVLFHLIEDDVWEDYLLNLFFDSEKYVIIFAADYDKDWAPHVLSRNFTSYISKNFPEWNLIEHIPTPKTLDTISDFYYYEKLEG